MRSRPVKILSSILACGLFLTFWAFFAPTKLGGATSYSITAGVSMEPMMHADDLALVREQATYRVGDVVLYQSPVLHKPVLHRIILIDGDEYFFKGDNNGFVDPGSAPRSALLGKHWFTVGQAGVVLGWFGKPSHAALVGTVATMVAVLAGTTTSRGRRRRHKGTPTMKRPKSALAGTSPPRDDRPANDRPANDLRADPSHPDEHATARRPPPYFEGPTWSLVTLGVLTALAIVVLTLGFSSPTDRVAQRAKAYEHKGDFSYSATTKSANAVYPTGVVSTGEPIYPSLVDAVTLQFGYEFDSSLPHDVTGTIELRAYLLSQTDTWQEVSNLVPLTDFTGDRTSVSGTFPLTELYTYIDSIAAQSGIAGANYSVGIQPIVHVTGTVDGTDIDEEFSPVLPFAVTDAAVRVDVAATPPLPGETTAPETADGALAAALAPSEFGSVPHVVANTVTIARYGIPVTFLRILGVVLFVSAILMALFHDRLRRRGTKKSEEDQIAARYHSLIVPVATLDRADGDPPIQVPDFAHLAGLAQFLERPILYAFWHGARTYAVDDDARRYIATAVDRRQRRAPDSPPPAAPTPAEPVVAATAPAPPPIRKERVSHRVVAARAGAVLLVLAVLGSFGISMTASTTVPNSLVGRSTSARLISQLTPAQCSSLTLTTILIRSGTYSTSSSQVLIIGSAGVDKITSTGNLNCIVGGGGKDVVSARSTSKCLVGPLGSGTNGASYTGCVKVT